MMNNRVNFKKNPFLVIVSYYVAVILIGTLLLKIPFLFNSGQDISWLDSFFMSNSSIATTGLVTFSFVETYNYFGWFMLILLFNLGGMGIIVINTVLSLFIRKKIGFQSRMLAKLDYNQTTQINIVGVLKRVVVYFLVVEIIATLFVFIRMLTYYDSPLDAFMNSLFMIASSISGSGFYNTVPFGGDYYIQFFVMIGMFFSFIGYPVIVDIHLYFATRFTREKFKFSRFTKIVVAANVVTIIMFALIFFLIERGNPNTEMYGLPFLEQIQWSMYMSFSMKSVGLSLFSNTADWQSLTLVFATIFMLIGGSPSSACGGIRVGAVYIIYKHIQSLLIGKPKVLSYGYIVNDRNILRAYAVSFLYILIAMISTFIIYVINNGIEIFDIWFDVVSGFTTTGFSVGALDQMNSISIFIIAILMGIGRVGIMNIIAINSYRQSESHELIQYLEKDVTI